MRLGTVAVAVGLTFTACSKSSNAPGSTAGDSGTAQPAAGSAPAPAAATNVQYVTSVAVLKKEPSDARTVKGPKDKQVPNWVSTLQRGEKVTLLDSKDDYARVRASDDKEGWIAKRSVLSGDGVREATVLIPTDTFERPDMLAMNPKRKIEPGSLILVIKSRDLFSEVNLAGSSTTWVLTNALVTDARVIDQAKLIDKARYLIAAKKDDEAKAVLATLRSGYSDSPLPDVLAKELGEPPANGAVPAAGEPTPAANQPAQPSGGANNEPPPAQPAQ
jgi:SH3-like domain-containing protein